MIVDKPDPKIQRDFLVKCISEWNWAIFPLHQIKRNFNGSKVWCACRKGFLCPTVGKHPLISWTDRTKHPDVDEACRMLERGITGWGIHLGYSNLVVVDIDPRNGGLETMRGIIGNTKYAENQFLVRTGSDGFHIYMNAGNSCDPVLGFWWNAKHGTTCMKWGPGFEILGGQHFVVLPFSPHKSGKIYEPICGTDKPIAKEYTCELLQKNPGGSEQRL